MQAAAAELPAFAGPGLVVAAEGRRVVAAAAW